MGPSAGCGCTTTVGVLSPKEDPRGVAATSAHWRRAVVVLVVGSVVLGAALVDAAAAVGLPVPLLLLDGPTLLEVTAVAGPLLGFVVIDDKDSNCGGGGVLPLRRHRGLDTMLKLLL